MALTIIEKIMSAHAGKEVTAGDIVELGIDTRVARDFGGANVVKNLESHCLGIDDSSRTFFTFDCNPGGSDQKYATNQHLCRIFARNHGIRVYDINEGIGTHLAIEKGLVLPGETIVSTDSHANILGAIGAFGQGMGDQDVAYAFASGKVWFKVPPSIKITVTGEYGENIRAKDLTLALVRHFGSRGLLGLAAEMYGPVVDRMSLSDRITMASMATEMGGIILLFPPNDAVFAALPGRNGSPGSAVLADHDAAYIREETVDLTLAEPLISRPGHPDDVVPISEVSGEHIDSAFIGSCTNGRYEDFKIAADMLKNRKIAPHVVMKVVPATDTVWQQLLSEGIVKIFKDAGVLIGNAGCAGCAAGQIGQNGPGEKTISTGNRNFPGKQGKGSVYLASPASVTASAIAGVICSETTLHDYLDREIVLTTSADKKKKSAGTENVCEPPSTATEEKPATFSGNIWVVDQDSIDTDMIFHNQHLAVTALAEMGQFTFGNLEGWTDFSKKAKPGDILITGHNFGAGSSRQQAVDCFKSLGIVAIIARSFGAIYERNAINAGLPLLKVDWTESDFKNGDTIQLDLRDATVINTTQNTSIQCEPFSEVQWSIYQRGGLLVSTAPDER